jgi:hypothetical protein
MSKKLKVDKEKVKNVYKKGLVSLEVIRLKEMPSDKEQAEEMYDEIVKHKTFLVEDLSFPCLIRLAYTDNKSKLRSIDPEHLEDMDKYELSETIQEILKEEGFPVIKSDFPEAPKDFDAEIIEGGDNE